METVRTNIFYQPNQLHLNNKEALRTIFNTLTEIDLTQLIDAYEIIEDYAFCAELKAYKDSHVHMYESALTKSGKHNNSNDMLYTQQLLMTDRQKAAVNELLKDIKLKEVECLNKIHARYCLLRGLKINIADLTRVDVPERSNYWQYWFHYGRIDQFFLMSREVFIEGGMPKLNIIFSAELNQERDK